MPRSQLNVLMIKTLSTKIVVANELVVEPKDRSVDSLLLSSDVTLRKVLIIELAYKC